MRFIHAASEPAVSSARGVQRGQVNRRLSAEGHARPRRATTVSEAVYTAHRRGNSLAHPPIALTPHTAGGRLYLPSEHDLLRRAFPLHGDLIRGVLLQLNSLSSELNETLRRNSVRAYVLDMLRVT